MIRAIRFYRWIYPSWKYLNAAKSPIKHTSSTGDPISEADQPCLSCKYLAVRLGFLEKERLGEKDHSNPNQDERTNDHARNAGRSGNLDCDGDAAKEDQGTDAG